MQMEVVHNRTAIGWAVALIAILLPPLSYFVRQLSGSIPMTASYILMWLLGILASVVAARTLSKWWYWLTGFWVAVFIAIRSLLGNCGFGDLGE